MMTKVEIPDRVFFRIGDVARLAQLKPYVLRYWETEFPVIMPVKGRNGQRVYRQSDVETVLMIKHLLHEKRLTIEGARKAINELRSDGELRSFKKDMVATPSVSDKTRQRVKDMRAVMMDLRILSATSTQKLFVY